MKNQLRKQKGCKTPDDWYGTFPNGTVDVSLIRMKGKGDKQWRVCVWGDDDYGLVQDGLTINEGYNLFHSITDGVTKEWLKERGFVDC